VSRRTGPALTGAATVTALAGAVAAGWALRVEPRWPTLRHVTVPALARSARAPLRVLHVSDLHLGDADDHLVAFVRAALDQAPDLVVVTGDLLGGPEGIEPALAALAHGGDAPRLAVLGSNDRYGPTPANPLRYLLPERERVLGEPLEVARLVRGLTDRGWLVLENTRTSVETVAGPVTVTALGDPHIDRDRPERLPAHPGGTLADGSDPNAAVLHLGLVHAPYRRALDALAADGVALALCGHTHGGQVRVPGVGALTTNCDLPRRQARGLSRHGAQGPWLHVSAGLGVSASGPMRFACRPEATLLEVVPPCDGRTRGD